MATIVSSSNVGSANPKATPVVTTTAVPANDVNSANKDRLLGTETLSIGQSLVSPNGKFNLILQDDCNFVLYDSDKKAIWAADSGRRRYADTKVLLNDCRLRVASSNGEAWTIIRNLYRSENYQRISRYGQLDNSKVLLVMQNDGNVVLSYDDQTLWTTKTARRTSNKLPTNGNQSYLYVGEPLLRDNTLKSQQNDFELKMEGDVILRWSGREVWRQKYGVGAPPRKLELLANGDLVLVDGTDSIMWSSGTAGQGNVDSYLAVEDDGNVTLNSNGKQIWSSNSKQVLTAKPRPPLPVSDPGPAGPDRLRVGDKLSPGQSIISPNGRFEMAFQQDGNFVLYDGSNPLWASQTTGGATPDEVVMRDDDNLVVGRRGTVDWSSKTRRRTGGGSAVLFVQDGGNAVIKSEGKIIWSTDEKLVQPWMPACDPVHPDNQVLRVGQYIPVNQPFTSANKQFSAILQPNGNLTIQRNATKTTVWSSNSGSNSAATQLALGFNCELAIYAADERKIWSSGQTLDRDQAKLTMRNDGKLTVVRDWADQELWSGGTLFPVSNGPTDSLIPGQSLALDQVLTAGDYQFGFTSNCNLFVRNNRGDTTYFYVAPRDLDNAARLTCNGDYQIEIFDTNGNSLWQSNNREIRYEQNWDGGRTQYNNRFWLRNDGVAAVHVRNQVLWSTRDASSGSSPKQVSTGRAGADRSTLTSGGTLLPGASLKSPNGLFVLTFQADSNLVIYRNGMPKWDSGTEGFTAGKVILEKDGNLVMYDQSGRRIWYSNRGDNGTPVFRMQDDGNAVVYVGARAIWASDSDRGRKV